MATAGPESAKQAYDQICFDTLTRRDEAFVHQHVVDAFAAQAATPATKPIGLVFALAGLYLAVERGWSGRQVQRAHMRMAARRRSWPVLPQPGERGAVTAVDVAAVAAGPDRDAAIRAWCACVWQAHAGCRATIVALLRELQVDDAPVTS